MNDKGRPIVSFRDRHPGSEHARFQAWRRRNPDGFFLTLLTAERARLHGARCSHLGHTEWQFDETGQSLTAERKVCATDRETLFGWASAALVEVRECRHCLRPRSPNKREPTQFATFSWGYSGWGNAVPQFLEAAAAAEVARGYGRPVFADVRLRRSVRAPGFIGRAFERVVGADRYRWFKGLGNESIVTGESKIRIADPSEAEDLLTFIQESASTKRRVLFFCSCEHVASCHRRTVATLLLRVASKRGIDLTVQEWPGEWPVVRRIQLPVVQRWKGASSIRIGKALPADGLATLPWGSMLVQPGNVKAMLTGPASYQDGWKLEPFADSEERTNNPIELAAEASRLRASKGLNARRR